ncbi:MAG TPA: cytochrome c oxidase subunit 3, partial [Anaerolineae bacterium]|nr:cytochrome c oxidase subunit 3 [Anaerolineae bacterium]
NIALPNLPLTVVGAVILLLSGGAMLWALKRIQAGDRRQLQFGLAGAFILAAIGLGLQVIDYTQLTFDWQINAYGSLFYTLGGFAFAVLLGGLIMNGMLLFWAGRGQYTARRHSTIENVALYWYSMIGVWLITFATLYLSPYLI